MTLTLPDTISWQEKYDPAMVLTDQTQADAYFEACVEHHLRLLPERSREEAERIERQNLGYWAAYYGDETRYRVERLYACAHPYFGAIAQKGAPTMEEAFAAGVRLGKRLRAEAAE